MTGLTRAVSEKARDVAQQKSSSNQREGQEIQALADETAYTGPLRDGQLAHLVAMRLNRSLNSPLFAQAMTRLQRQWGNGYVQRLIGSPAAQSARTTSARNDEHDQGHERVHVLEELDDVPTLPSRIIEPSEAAEEDRRTAAGVWDSAEVVVRQRLPAGAIARDLATLVTEAEARTGTSRAAGAMLGPEQEAPMLTDEQHQEIVNLIPGNQPLAVSRAWSYLSLPGEWRVFPPPYVTENLGRVDGVQIPQVARLDAVTIPYVLATPECFGSEGSEHWRHHRPDEIRAIIQVSPRVLSGSPEEAASRLVSTLLHEYTHVEWYVAEGLHERIGFLPIDRAVGGQEILSLEPLPSERESPEALGEFQRSSAVLEALDEINAHCIEIENAGRTRLARSFQIKETVDELWRYYRRYVARLDGAQPDVAVAGRVHRCIQRGRRMFESYLDSAAGRRFRSHRDFLLERCPEGYDASLLPAQVRGTQ